MDTASNTRYFPLQTTLDPLLPSESEDILFQWHPDTLPVNEIQNVDCDYYNLAYHIREQYPQLLPFDVQAMAKEAYGYFTQDWDIQLDSFVTDLKIKQFNLLHQPTIDVKGRLQTLCKHQPNLRNLRAALLSRTPVVIPAPNNFAISLKITPYLELFRATIQIDTQTRTLDFDTPTEAQMDAVTYNAYHLLLLAAKLQRHAISSHLCALSTTARLDAQLIPALVSLSPTGRRIVKAIHTGQIERDLQRATPLNAESSASLLGLARKVQKKYRYASDILSGCTNYLGISDSIEVVRKVYADTDSALKRLTDLHRTFIIPEMCKQRLNNTNTAQHFSDALDTDTLNCYELYYDVLAKQCNLHERPPTDAEYQQSTRYLVYLDDLTGPKARQVFSSLDQATRYVDKYNETPGYRLSLAAS